MVGQYGQAVAIATKLLHGLQQLVVPPHPDLPTLGQARQLLQYMVAAQRRHEIGGALMPAQPRDRVKLLQVSCNGRFLDVFRPVG